MASKGSIVAKAIAPSQRVEVVEQLRPLRDQLVVRPLEWNASSILHVVRNGRALRGVVVAAGPGDYVKKRKPHPDGKRQIVTRTSRFQAMTVKVGDVVELGGLNVFDGLGYNFPEIMMGATRCIICQEADVTLVGDGAEGADEVVNG